MAPLVDPVPAEAVRRIQDREHLRMLSIGFYAYAGMIALFGLFPLIYVALGLLFVLVPSFGAPPHPASGEAPPELFGALFIGFGTVFTIVGETIAALNFVAGRSIARRQRRTFCMVMAGLDCLHMPLGTVLGVCGLIVLSRPGVRTEFDGGLAAGDDPPAPRWPTAG
jgi:hypothetical protein